MLSLSEAQVKELRKKHYGVVGRHSAVQICNWTKKSILGRGTCYKEKFYGAHAHKCAQFSPVVLWCNMNCIYCWRPMEWMKYREIGEDEVDDPDTIIKGVVEERRKLLIGFLGNPKADRRKVLDALKPDHYAISLSGEPTLYPRLDEMVRLLRDKYKARTIFIVTNGQVPEMLRKLDRTGSLPTQLYLSIRGSNPELERFISRPVLKDYWERMMESLEVVAGLEGRTRRVVRMTMIKGINTDPRYIDEYARMIEAANPDFIEVKAYMHLGLSTQRLSKENMPTHEEIMAYARRLAERLEGFELVDEQRESRIALLMNRDSPVPLKIYPEESS